MSNSIVILGSGSIASQHSKNLDNKYDLYTLKESSTSSNEFRSFLESKKIKAVIICTSSGTHMKFVKVCIECQVPFYCEKPICLSSMDVNFLRSRTSKEILKNCVGFNLRYHPGIIWLKEKIENHLHPINFNIRVGHDVSKWRTNRDINEIFSLNKQKGGGAISELSHECDIACYLFENANEWTSFSINDPWKNEVDAQTVIVLKMKNSIGSINLDMVSPVLHRQIVISSLDFFIELDLVKSKAIGIIDNNKINIKFDFNRNASLKNSLNNFLDNLDLKNSAKPLNLLKDCLNSSKLIAEIYEQI